MRGFIPHTNDDGRVQPWQYLPCGAIKPSIGMALVQSSGNLAIATGTSKPTYISMFEAADTLTAGTLIPVIAVQPDMYFEVPNQASLADVAIGTAVTIHTDGCQITATTSSGVAVIVDKVDGSGTGNPTIVHF